MTDPADPPRELPSSDGAPWRRAEIESPCVRLCMLHPETGLCLGCARSGEEIGRWSAMTPEDRRRVMDELPSREPAPGGRRGGREARRRDPRREG